MKSLFQFLFIISSFYIQLIQTTQDQLELQTKQTQFNQLRTNPDIQQSEQQVELLGFDQQDSQKFLMSLFSKKRTPKPYGRKIYNLRPSNASLTPQAQLNGNLTNQTIVEVFNITNYDQLVQAFKQNAQKYEYYNPDTGRNETILIYNDTNHFNSSSGDIQEISLNDTVIKVNRTQTSEGLNKTIISFNQTYLNSTSNAYSKKTNEKNQNKSIYVILIKNPQTNQIEKQAEYELRNVDLQTYDSIEVNNFSANHWYEQTLDQNNTYKFFNSSSNNTVSLYEQQSLSKDYDRTIEIIKNQSDIESNNTYKLQSNYQYDQEKYIEEGVNRNVNKLEERDSFHQIYNNSGYTITENGTLRNSSIEDNYHSHENINSTEINGFENKVYQRAANESGSIYKSYWNLNNNSTYDEIDSHQKTNKTETRINNKIEGDLYDFTNTTSTIHNEAMNNQNIVSDKSNNTIAYQLNNTQELKNWQEIPINNFLASELPIISQAIAKVNQEFQPYKNGYEFSKVENILEQGQDKNLITLKFVNSQNDSQYYQVAFNKSQMRQQEKSLKMLIE